MKTDHVDLLNRVVRLAESESAKTYLVRAISFDNPSGASAWLEECNELGGARGGELLCVFLSKLCFE